MDVNRDRSRHKTKIRARERTCHSARIPTVIESAIGRRINIRKKCGRILVHDRNPDFVKLSDNLSEPFVAGGQTSDILVCSIDVRAPPKSGLLRCYCIGDQGPHCCGRWRVESANEQQCRIVEIADRTEASEIWILSRAGNLTRMKSEHSQLRIN